MEQDRYLTLAAPSQAVYKEKGSKFLAFAYPLNTEEEVKARLKELQKTYFDASHHCYAYSLGLAPDETSRAFDDGEPAHTAGTPILGQIRSKQLSNVLLVTVRYFGGTKLGAGGLVQAYKAAAKAALEEALIVEKTAETLLNISFDYTVMNEVMKTLKQSRSEVKNREETQICRLLLSIPRSEANELKEKLLKIETLKAY